ncbi:MAG: hypothetical protein K8S99_08380 [Planctomycetes bacterium]|nr:hypothetical protein [Planctomycetota bacterium]
MPLLHRLSKGSRRARSRPIFEPLEGRVLLAAFTNADLAGDVTLAGLHVSGTVTFDGQTDQGGIGSITGGSLFEDAFSNNDILSGDYLVTANGDIIVGGLQTSTPGPVDSLYGALNSTKDIGFLAPSNLPTGDGSDTDFSLLILHNASSYSRTDLAGTWSLSGHNFSGQIVLNSQGQLTSGFQIDDTGITTNFTSGSATINPDGTVFLSGATDDPFNPTFSVAGAMNTGKDVVALNDNLAENFPQNNSGLGVLTRAQGTYASGDFFSLWQYIGPYGRGLIIAQSNGAVQGSITGVDGAVHTVTGSFTLAADGSFTDTLNISDVGTFSYEGVMNASRSFIAANEPFSDSSGVSPAYLLRYSVDTSSPESQLGGFIGGVTVGKTPIEEATVLPGDKLAVPLTIVNSGSQTAAGDIKIDLYLSTDLTLGVDDRLVSATTVRGFNLAGGDNKEFNLGASVPPSITSGTYYLIGVIDPDNATGSGNVNIASPSPIDIELMVGEVGGRGNLGLTITLPGLLGATATLKLKGGGSANVLPNDDGSYDISFLGTSAKTSLTVTTSLAEMTFRNIIIGDDAGFAPQSFAAGRAAGSLALAAQADTSALGKLIAKTSRLTGNLSAPHGIGAITLGAVESEATINIGAGSDPDAQATLAFSLVEDTQLTSEMAIKSLTVTKWTRSDGHESSITAPSIGALAVKGDKKFSIPGDFQADLNLSAGTDMTLGSAKIAGDLSKADWEITGAAGALAVAGDVDEFTLHTSTFLKSLKAASIKLTSVTVGSDAGSITASDWLAGSLTAATAKSLAFKGNVSASSAGNFGAAVTLTGNNLLKSTLPSIKIAGTVLGGDWILSGPIGSITALATDPSWTLQSGGTGLDLAKLTVTQNLGGTIDINSLGKASVGGNILNGTRIILNRAFDAGTPKVLSLASLSVKGIIDALTLRTPGGIGSITAASITDSDITAGLATSFTGLPASLADYAAATAPLASVKLTGAGVTFTNTRVAAGVINTLALGTIDTANGSALLGVAGDSIKKLTALGSVGPIALPADGAATVDGDFAVRLLV